MYEMFEEALEFTHACAAEEGLRHTKFSPLIGSSDDNGKRIA